MKKRPQNKPKRQERKLGQRHKDQPVRQKAFIATPAYNGMVDTDYAVSLAETCQAATIADIGILANVMGNGAFIELARNTFVRMFLDTDCTHLFFIDSDLRWEPRAFIGLMASGREVCAGMYRRRQEPEEYPVRFIKDEDGGLQIEDGGWIPCDRVPTGFLCIERKVIEEMAADADIFALGGVAGDAPELFYTEKVKNENGKCSFMGEDFAWCRDYVKRYDKPIWVWPDFDFTHGGYDCNWQHYLSAEIKRIAEIVQEEGIDADNMSKEDEELIKVRVANGNH